MTKPRALILHATGTNRDQEAALAFAAAGALAEIVHINQLLSGERSWQDYQILALPGGFSYADALGAGKLLALDLEACFAQEVSQFVASGKPVIGICNGFQALVKSGVLLPQKPPVSTLSFNACGHFECRWVTLRPISQKCLWTQGLDDLIDCPVAHGEGNFIPASPLVTATLQELDQIALIYCRPDGSPAEGEYPHNPNGSVLDIAGICNPFGNVLGLMPHPENHLHRHQHPRWTRGYPNRLGLHLFINGVKAAGEL